MTTLPHDKMRGRYLVSEKLGTDCPKMLSRALFGPKALPCERSKKAGQQYVSVIRRECEFTGDLMPDGYGYNEEIPVKGGVCFSAATLRMKVRSRLPLRCGKRFVSLYA